MVILELVNWSRRACVCNMTGSRRVGKQTSGNHDGHSFPVTGLTKSRSNGAASTGAAICSTCCVCTAQIHFLTQVGAALQYWRCNLQCVWRRGRQYSFASFGSALLSPAPTPCAQQITSLLSLVIGAVMRQMQVHEHHTRCGRSRQPPRSSNDELVGKSIADGTAVAYREEGTRRPYPLTGCQRALGHGAGTTGARPAAGDREQQHVDSRGYSSSIAIRGC